MQQDLRPPPKMTIEEFLAFTEERPDGERWELIEGVAVMQASATDFHQIIAGNIVAHLRAEKRQRQAPWHPLLGIGTLVPASKHSLPQPDVMVKERSATGQYTTDDALVLFEVLAKSNRKADRDWRLSVYRSIPNCRHYVTVAQNRVRVECYDRATDWKPRALKSIDDVLDLPALAARLPLSEIYWDTPLAASN